MKRIALLLLTVLAAFAAEDARPVKTARRVVSETKTPPTIYRRVAR